jgi:hypothetical protein
MNESQMACKSAFTDILFNIREGQMNAVGTSFSFSITSSMLAKFISRAIAASTARQSSSHDVLSTVNEL